MTDSTSLDIGVASTIESKIQNQNGDGEVIDNIITKANAYAYAY